MTDTPTPIVIERRYRAALTDLWALWTTAEGLESWWGPPGFAVTVQQMDLIPGGTLRYTMTAVAPDMVTFLKKTGMPTATQCQATYDTITPPSVTGPTARLTWRNLVDFVPGQVPYHTNMAVDLLTEAGTVLVRLTFDPMHDPVWTERQRMGWDLELGKLQTVLGNR